MVSGWGARRISSRPRVTEDEAIRALWRRLRWLLDPLPMVHAGSALSAAALATCEGVTQVLSLGAPAVGSTELRGDPLDPATWRELRRRHGPCHAMLTGVLDGLAPEHAARLLAAVGQLIGAEGVVAARMRGVTRAQAHVLFPGDRFKLFGEGREEVGGHATWWLMARLGKEGDEFGEGQTAAASRGIRTTDQAPYWDAQASSYAAQRSPSKVDAATLAELPPRGDVLELGAGPGVFTRQALTAEGHARYIATDISPVFCTMLREIPGVEVWAVGHADLPEISRRFDTVYAMATLHHLDPAVCTATLAWIAQALRPGGRLALVEDWAFSPQTEVLRRLWALRQALRDRVDPGEGHPSEAEWSTRLEEAGLRVLQCRQVARVESLDRYSVLDDPACRADLDWLAARAPLEVPMTILVAERES